MNIFITGGSGLIGSSLIESFSCCDFGLTCLSRRDQPSLDNRVKWIKGNLIHGDLYSDDIADADIIIHMANDGIPLNGETFNLSSINRAIEPTLALINEIKKANKVPLLIFLSSGGTVYGNLDKVFNEMDNCQPVIEYGIQKLAIERYIHSAQNQGILRAVILRISNAYGGLISSDNPQGLIGTTINRIKEGKSIRLIGNPKNVRDYIFLDDVIDAIYRSIHYSGEFDIYNIGSGVGYSVEDVIAKIVDICGYSKQMPIKKENFFGQHRLPSRAVLDIRKAQEELDWEPKVSLDEGLKRMYTKFLKNEGRLAR